MHGHGKSNLSPDRLSGIKRMGKTSALDRMLSEVALNIYEAEYVKAYKAIARGVNL